MTKDTKLAAQSSRNMQAREIERQSVEPTQEQAGWHVGTVRTFAEVLHEVRLRSDHEGGEHVDWALGPQAACPLCREREGRMAQAEGKVD